jgi:hypothetical protein
MLDPAKASADRKDESVGIGQARLDWMARCLSRRKSTVAKPDAVRSRKGFPIAVAQAEGRVTVGAVRIV